VDRLRSELTNGDVVFPMLQVLYNLSNHNDEINNPTDKDLDKLVGSMKGKSHYGSTFIRYYLSALIRLDQFEDYYREASKLVKVTPRLPSCSWYLFHTVPAESGSGQ